MRMQAILFALKRICMFLGIVLLGGVMMLGCSAVLPVSSEPASVEVLCIGWSWFLGASLCYICIMIRTKADFFGRITRFFIVLLSISAHGSLVLSGFLLLGDCRGFAESVRVVSLFIAMPLAIIATLVIVLRSVRR